MNTTIVSESPVRYDLMLWSDGEMGRFDSSLTYTDALMTLRAHYIVGEEQDEEPLEAEIWAVYADGTTKRVDS